MALAAASTTFSIGCALSRTLALETPEVSIAITEGFQTVDLVHEFAPPEDEIAAELHPSPLKNQAQQVS